MSTPQTAPKPSRLSPAERARRERHARTLTRFVEVYCRAHHGAREPAALCESCRDLLSYAVGRLERCLHEPKPACRKCATHCYAGDYRARTRQVMRFSGMHFVKRGRLDWLVRYFL